MDCLTPNQRHKAMKANKGKDTTIELLLRKALWQYGIRYRKNYKKIPGIPDIAITKYKIAIFCDGEFWHGKNFTEKIFENNAKYWNNKIKRNKEHDLDITITLRDMDWIVLRFWETDIKKRLDICVKEVLDTIEIKKKQKHIS
jgi:DNA mismatch endonuclease (patch repair protein)